MKPTKPMPGITAADRIAMFVGSGILGAFTGAMLWIPVSFLTLLLGAVLPLSWFALAFGFGAALGAAVAPDATAEFIAKAWHGVVSLWRAVSGV